MDPETKKRRRCYGLSAETIGRQFSVRTIRRSNCSKAFCRNFDEGCTGRCGNGWPKFGFPVRKVGLVPRTGRCGSECLCPSRLKQESQPRPTSRQTGRFALPCAEGNREVELRPIRSLWRECMQLVDCRMLETRVDRLCTRRWHNCSAGGKDIRLAGSTVTEDPLEE